MSFVLQRSLRSFKPLTCIGSTLYLARGRALFRSSLDLEQIEPVAELPLVERFAQMRPRRLMDRILRRGLQTAVPLGAHHLLVVHRSDIWKVDLRTGATELEFTIPGGRRLLSLTRVDSSAGGQWCFGEYFDNVVRGPVNLWARPDTPEGTWRITGSFADRQIYHVHGIAQDPVTGRVHVMTGDFDDEAGLWRTTSALDRFSPVLRGQQAYRACWMWHSPGGPIYYATDTQLQTNALMELNDADTPSAGARSLATIEGSSIYAGFGERFVAFSSSVEPGELSGNRWKDLLERRRGPGILSDWARIYHLDAEGRLSVVFSAEKDRWPHRLAQFGAFTFPTGQLPDDTIVAYGVALREVDDTCLLLRRTGAAPDRRPTPSLSL